MGNYKGPTEGGSGGKRGHSAMEHWTKTEELKDTSKIHRRVDDLRSANEGVDEYVDEAVADNRPKANCDECDSSYYSECSAYVELCPECANLIYGHPACEHFFSDGRCSKCYWDGSYSTYTASLKFP